MLSLPREHNSSEVPEGMPAARMDTADALLALGRQRGRKVAAQDFLRISGSRKHRVMLQA